MRLILILGALLCAISKAADFELTMKPSMPGFQLRSSIVSGYTYTAFVNGEPVKWAHSPSIALLRGHPLKQGTNQFAVAVVFPPNYKDDVLSRPMIRMTAWVQDTLWSADQYSWTEVDSLSEWGPFKEPYKWDSDFVITNQVKAIDFDELGKDEESIKQHCKSLAIKLAKVFQERNPKRIAKTYRLPDAAAIRGMFPEWFFSGTTNEVSVASVTEESQLSAVAGKCFVLVYCSPQHLVSYTLKSEQLTLNVDCFVFARRNNSWEVMGTDGQWLGLDLGP